MKNGIIRYFYILIATQYENIEYFGINIVSN